MGAYHFEEPPMSLLLPLSARTTGRHHAQILAEEPHFDPSAVRRAIVAIERSESIGPNSRLAIRSDLDGFGVAEARRALAGLPRPGDYRVVVKALRYRTQPSLSALCEFDERRIILRVPEPFRPFQELVYYSARRRPGAGMQFSWVSENVAFRARRDVLRFLYCHEWLHWYMREVRRWRSGAETACDRFALRNFRRRRVTVDNALDALRGCRPQALPSFELVA
jgi:hypothetical protein